MSRFCCIAICVIAISALLLGAAYAGPSAYQPPSIPVQDCLNGKLVSLVVVKDYILLKNSGAAVPIVEFQRYFPVVDSEQIVLGRWINARSAAGTNFPVSIANVNPDSEGNLIHTYRLNNYPAKQNVCITVTSLVARRERPAPAGKYPIPEPEQYPEQVRQYLSESRTVTINHPEIRKQANDLLNQTHDAYELAGLLADIMKAKSYKPIKPSPNDKPDPNETVASRTLRYGASCCASAVCCASVLRACGIPTQITYSPAGYLHGIVRFYLNGYGWVRMDGTCGTGKLPLVQHGKDLGLVRLFDMPLAMEKAKSCWPWPYFYCDESGGNPVHMPSGSAATVMMGHDGKWYKEPIPPHYEPGSWNEVIGAVPFEGAWKDWDRLATASREAVLRGQLGVFTDITGSVSSIKRYLDFIGPLVPKTDVAVPQINAIPKRGIAVLASSIGNDCSPADLAEFVQQGNFSPVVIDWAWVTYHWDHTNFAAVNKLMDLMAAKNIPVIAMYRPRFLSNPAVPTQMAADGKRSVDHAEICYSDPSARKWGISWGEKILDKCPGFKEIIIYNPVNNCRCPNCKSASANGQYAVVKGFLSEARSTWRAKQPGVKLGVVHMPAISFWEAALSTIDVVHPFLCIRENVDPAKEVANIQALQSIAEDKMGSSLAKITWEEGAKVSIDKLKTVDELASAAKIPYFFWTFETLFTSSLYDINAVAKVLGMDPAAAADVTSRLGRPVYIGTNQSQPAQPNPLVEKEYTPEQIKSTSAEIFLKRMQQAEPGYARFAAMHALAAKAKESTGEARKSILALVIKAMKDKSRIEYQRFQYCYVISGCGDEQGVPDLIDVLLNDESEVMRAVAAEALANFPDSKTAHDALLQSARRETSQRVRAVLIRRLGKDMPAVSPGTKSQATEVNMQPS